MPKKRAKGLQVDRAAEYVDSPLMTQRLRYGRELSVRIYGNHGIYRTKTEIGKTVDGTCTCPSEVWPCKHVRALEATWKCNPSSFVDIKDVLCQLSHLSKAELLTLIGEMAMRSPQSLIACGVRAFELEDEDVEDPLD